MSTRNTQAIRCHHRQQSGQLELEPSVLLHDRWPGDGHSDPLAWHRDTEPEFQVRLRPGAGVRAAGPGPAGPGGAGYLTEAVTEHCTPPPGPRPGRRRAARARPPAVIEALRRVPLRHHLDRAEVHLGIQAINEETITTKAEVEGTEPQQYRGNGREVWGRRQTPQHRR